MRATAARYRDELAQKLASDAKIGEFEGTNVPSRKSLPHFHASVCGASRMDI
jgi:hypothetical protein